MCIKQSRVSELNQWAHNSHEHFLTAIVMDKFMINYYWNTRASDVEKIIQTCDVCQRMGPRPEIGEIGAILAFSPWSLVMDFIGKIKPTSLGGEEYVLVVVDYYSKFILAEATVSVEGQMVTAFWQQIAKMYGYPSMVYSDNGSQFEGKEVRTLLKSHGITLTCAPISHPELAKQVEWSGTVKDSWSSVDL